MKLNIGSLVGGGIDLLRYRPGAVLVWGLIYFAGIAGLEMMSRHILRSGTGDFSYFLIALLLALIIPLLFTAAMRALLRPRETEFASLDFGMDELRVIGLGLLLLIIAALANGIVGFFTAPLTLALLPAAGAEPSTGLVIAAIVITLIRLLVPCLVLASLSLAFPLVLIRRRINLDEAWRLSEGHVWPLFLTYLSIAVGMALLGLAITAVTDWATFAALFGGRDPDMTGLAQLIRIAGPIDAMTVIRWVLSAGQATLGIVLMAGAMVAAARRLVPDKEGLTETFS